MAALLWRALCSSSAASSASVSAGGGGGGGDGIGGFVGVHGMTGKARSTSVLRERDAVVARMSKYFLGLAT